MSKRNLALASDQWPHAVPHGRLEGEIHVWLAMLDDVQPFPWETVLSPDEQDRAARFLFARDRDRFVTVRGLLRRLLACYLRIAPGAVRFSYGQYGKPSLDAHPGAPSFNVSHSHEAAAFVIAREGDLGIDIEALRPVRAAEQIAGRYFAREDADAFRSLPLSERDRAFFICWARREAFVKAVGRGLSLLLNVSEMASTPRKPGQAADTETTESDNPRWTLTELPAVAGYVGALAVLGEPRAIQYRAWNGSECEADTGR